MSWSKSLADIGRVPLALLATLVLAAMLFGGSSRYDVMQNVLMQPLAWLVAGAALVFASKDMLRDLRWPVLMLLALVAITVLQLVPLPLEMWMSLPGREPLGDVAGALGSDAARPASMVPWRTLNALMALGIPIAALLVMACLGRKAAMPVLAAIVVLAAANALMALMQIATGYSDASYPYAITNFGAPVGIFANRNHSAVLGALAMLVIAFLATRDQKRRLPGAEVLLWTVFGAIFLTILVNGSRAGLLTTGVALVATALLVQQRIAPAKDGGERGLVKFVPVAIIVAFAAGLFLLFLFADRLVAFERMVEANPLEDLRFRILPILGEMIATYFPIGTGFGAFEDVYRIHETPDLLGPRYLNMAHNDWLQWLIEAGLAGLLLLAAFLFWCARIVWRLRGVGRGYVVLALAGLAILAIASFFDYPLRTPIFQVVGVWFICALALVANAAMRQGVENEEINEQQG
ncbi:O-antigen ligase family protein [Aurantiacibacter sp. MUD11]|uniref:O-antigen ligase family protein n=1 Tax=Aurantiacibacter sp. MUD11 TaxID=3003265 RepID=UPI0022AB10AC|nr:O-antigen ligase family protein [Aurantiacibacter sp. MUD11]WAT17577.1 O-antigen ligase family protein [Aurantiacibacter sp. MUD11]